MKIDIMTLFPDMFVSPFQESIIERAREKGLVEINTVNIRDAASGRHLQVDDYPYGGGVGMVMKADVVLRSLESIRSEDSWVVYLSPQGKVLKQQDVETLASRKHLILLCGHYEGIDERILAQVDEEISVGDYVLTGGEIPAMIVVDAVSRLLPGVLGHDESSEDESFADGWLEYPQYTRPAEVQGMEVPPVLLSGHHENIRKWRKKQSLLRTLLKRPDLLLNREYDKEERKLLEEILFNEENKKR